MVNPLDFFDVIVLGALLVFAVAGVVQEPGRRRVDILLMMATIAVPVIQGVIEDAWGEGMWVSLLSSMAIVAHPYFTVRVVDHVRPVPLLVQRLFLALVVASWLVLVWSVRGSGEAVGVPRALLVLFFLATESYAFGAMVVGATRARGTTRRRLSIAAAGIGVLALTILLVGLEPYVPQLAAASEFFAMAAVPLLAVFFYVAFAPPRWLRRTWQDHEFRRFILAVTQEKNVEARPDVRSQLFVESAAELLAAQGAFLRVRMPDGATHTYHAGPQRPDLDGVDEDGAREKGFRLWHRRGASLEVRRLLEELEAEALLDVHLGRLAGVEGRLLVPVIKVPLFAEEDVEAVRQLGRNVLFSWAQHATLEQRQRLQQELWETKARTAEEASRLKNEFVANMSHEVRTPLNAVLGMAALLQATPLDSQQQEYARKIESSGQHLLAMLADILDFSRIEAGYLQLEQDVFPLRSVIEEALDIVAGQANQKGLELLYEMAEGVPEGVASDRTRLRQVLVNLVGNAVKFTEKGEVAVHVAARRDGRVVLEFEVRDTGPGIPERDQEAIFDVFVQGDASRTRRHGGAGLGLAISRRLVEAAGGTIGVESKPGLGATFRFTWPVEEADLPEAMPWADHPEILRGRRVLIVDDNESNLHILRHHFQAWGLVPEVALRAQDALARLGDGYDIVVTDQVMPGVDGPAFIRLLRERLREAMPPVILLSSQGTEGGRDQSVVAHLMKPVKPSDLYDAVLKALAPRRRVRRGSALREDLAARLPMRILVAEDSSTNRDVIVGMLRRLGYDPDVAENGLEAVGLARQKTYDLILMDLQMPIMDGLEATRRLRASGNPARIVALTAHAGTEQRQACKEAGMVGYLVKPLGAEVLVGVLQQQSPAAPPRVPEDVQASLRATFRQEATQTAREVDAARQAGDAAELRRLGHRLKSAAAALGHEDVARRAQELEADPRPERAQALLDEVQRAVGQ